MTSRTTTTTVALAAALGVGALVAACGPVDAAHLASDPPTARAAHDDPPVPLEEHVVLEPGDEVDLDGEQVSSTSHEVEIAWDGERVVLPAGAELVDANDDPAGCAERLAAVAAEGTQGTVGRSLPGSLLHDGAQACVRTDEGTVLHVELHGPDVRDELQVAVRAQLPR
jgi:hypothetical protein